MVYIEAWDEFQKAAEELYASAPKKARYTAKWRRKDGELVLKVTDDETCLKYKTMQMSDLKRFDKLNAALMVKMTNKKPAAPAPITSIPATAPKKKKNKGKKR